MKIRVYTGDTAVLTPLTTDDAGNPVEAATFEWSIKRPDDTTETSSGSFPLASGEQPVVYYDNTDLPGRYVAQITYVYGASAITKSVVLPFEVVNPLQNEVILTDADAVVESAWMKLEDLFDSELGGPHLRDVTRGLFDRDRLALMLPDALYTINNTYQPATSYDPSSFPYQQHAPLLSQALLVQSIRHLMRSYVEQYQPAGGGNISYFDRRDYLQRWQQVYQIEVQQLNDWLDLFKRDQMEFGSTSTLVGGYASWYGRYPRYMRGRYPYIARW